MTAPIRMNWRCTHDGCYMEKQMPDLSVFSNCFPERKNPIHLTDIDGAVEVGGQFLFIEWKNDENAQVPLGQEIFIQRLSLKPGITVMVMWGNRNTQNIKRIQIWSGGVVLTDAKVGLVEARAEVAAWAAAAETAGKLERASADRKSVV